MTEAPYPMSGAIQLAKALDVYNERLEALGHDPRTIFRIGTIGDDQTRLLLSGLDLDLREVNCIGEMLEKQRPKLQGIAERGELSIASIWLQGLAVGLIAASRGVKE